jgi:alkanesulfonate monooxygenase SsuD/methylene tetrahydromethanopterin reductase-like flavin-dependent oxidoreductase (luciferase family)
MRYGLDVTNFGEYADPRRLADLARRAEGAGWDGLFVWDHVAAPWGVQAAPAMADPWVLLAAAACATERLTLATHVTPVARRRPHVVATQAATLDHLSGGRFVLGVGLGGVPAEFEAFGEEADPVVRAARLDEGLDLIAALWSGEEVDHRGRWYRAVGVRHDLRPVQRPRVPVWVGGTSGPALLRAARWDGWTAGLIVGESGGIARPPEAIAAAVEEIATHRSPGAGTPFHVAVAGPSDPKAPALVGEFADAGVTWWLEALNGFRGTYDEMATRVDAGPPSDHRGPSGN